MATLQMSRTAQDGGLCEHLKDLDNYEPDMTTRCENTSYESTSGFFTILQDFDKALHQLDAFLDEK